MQFNSIVFIIFAAFFFGLWPLAKRVQKILWGYITVSSFVFYGWWDWRFLFLIVGSGLLDFSMGLLIKQKPGYKKIFLFLSIFGNIGVLAAFKYSNFMAENISSFLQFFGLNITLHTKIPEFLLILPIGISFYTFQSLSYTIDIYRGQLNPTRHVLHFFSYLAMFPQLVAGPIVRARDLLPQLEETPEIGAEDRWVGLKLIVYGFFKKVVIADSLAPRINEAFGSIIPSTSSLFWWSVVLAFAVQIYCDFSGYTDIARGLARWMGYHLTINFSNPYSAASLREFWSRWHITLSTWFRDYLYIPLGGSRTRVWRSHLNMWIVMLVSGLWHGAQWHFVAWGAFHALFLSIERVTKWPNFIKQKLEYGKAFVVGLVFTQVLVGWVFFRAESIGKAFYILKTMLTFGGGLETGLGARAYLALSVFFAREIYIHLPERFILFLQPLQVRYEPVALSILVAASVYLRGQGDAFIYFAF